MMKLIDTEIENYAISKSSVPGQLCESLAQYTYQHCEMPQMLAGPMEGSFLGLLCRLIGAKRVLEIGTFTGYSTLAMAEQLPEDGVVHTLDINAETVSIGQKYWNQSPSGKKIQSFVGPALETINKLETGYDLVFIDADKTNYRAYFEAVLSLLSNKGIVVFDNMLWSGRVIHQAQDESTKALQELNDYLKSRTDLYVTLLPIRDGVTVVARN